MARGQQKIQSQQKAQAKVSAQKKQANHNLKDQKKAASAGLSFVCEICKSQMPDPKTYKQHFESKHSKCPLPESLKDA